MVCEERLGGLMNRNGFLQCPRGRIGGRSSRDAIAVGNFLASEPAASARPAWHVTFRLGRGRPLHLWQARVIIKRIHLKSSVTCDLVWALVCVSSSQLTAACLASRLHSSHRTKHTIWCPQQRATNLVFGPWKRRRSTRNNRAR